MDWIARSVMRAGAACLLVVTTLMLASAQSAPGSAQADRTITLEEAISLASKNEPAFVAAQAEAGVSRLDRTNAQMSMLPAVIYHNQAIYTQPNGVAASRIGQTANAPSPVFIANNAVREYASQGVVTETLGFGQIGAVRLADANAARAEAELEIAHRGLVSTVIALYCGSEADAEKVTVAEKALTEANQFLDITQKREAERESAHADVLKAELQQQQRQRDSANAHLAADKSRLELGVLIFPDLNTSFKLASSAMTASLPNQPETETLARESNPELRSAMASLQASRAETYSARAAMLPTLDLNFTYGIDATNIGVNGPDGIRNLGYSTSAQFDIPVWDWLTSERKLKQSRLREAASKIGVSATQRRLIANLGEFYAEAREAGRQMNSYDTSVTTARESLRLTTLRYVDGESTVLEVVDAQSTLTSAESAQIDGRLRFQLAIANLQTLTGKF